MPIRSKFLADRAISNEEFDRRQQINSTLVSDLADALRAPVSAALDESLRRAMNDDWLVPAHMLLLELAGTEGRPAIEEVRTELDAMLRRSSLQSTRSRAFGSSIEQSTREIALDAATHLLAQWHARVKECFAGKGVADKVLLDRKLAPNGTGSWRALLSPERLARWNLKPEDLDPAFERFAALLDRRLNDTPLPVGSGLHLGGIRVGPEKHLVLTTNVEVLKRRRVREAAPRVEVQRASTRQSLMQVVRRVQEATTGAIGVVWSGSYTKRIPIEHTVTASFTDPAGAVHLDLLLSGQHSNAAATSQFVSTHY